MAEVAQPMISEGTPEINPALALYAEVLETRADQLTKLRSDSAKPLGGLIALTNPNWLVLAGVVSAQVTDFFDGRLARKAASIRGVETSAEGAVKDPEADKKLVKGQMQGLIVRFLSQREHTAAAIVGANYSVIQHRDKRMERNRARVVEEQLDPNALKAIFINKAKMFSQCASLDLLTSPLVERRPVRLIALGLLSVSTALGLIGERRFRQKIDNLVAQNK